MRLRPLLSTAFLLCGVLACDDGMAPPDPGGASYSAEFDPGSIIYATINCDRLMTHAILSLGGPRTRGFDLSINITEDCTHAGGGYTYWEVLILGHYAVEGDELTFTPDSGSTPSFTGTYDFSHVSVTLPVHGGLSVVPVDVVLGSKSPF